MNQQAGDHPLVGSSFGLLLYFLISWYQFSGYSSARLSAEGASTFSRFLKPELSIEYYRSRTFQANTEDIVWITSDLNLSLTRTPYKVTLL